MALHNAVTHPSAWPSFELARETGDMELIVAETAMERVPRPTKVSTILTRCLAKIDGQDASLQLVRRLSVGSREWLLQQVASQCRPAQDWHEVRCTDCGSCFDIAFDLADLPRAAVADDFPVVSIEATNGSVALGVPNGAIEERLASCPSLSTLAFLKDCAVDPQGAEQLAKLPADQLDQIDIALDAATPEPADSIGCICPDCGGEVTARIDPLSYAFPSSARVLQDVHVLSSTYHWSEADVLSMPTRRRRSYVNMVTAAKGAA